MSSPAQCGFPSPADDDMHWPLDLIELLIANQAATFAVRIAGESMTGAGLFPGDIAVVDRSRTAEDGSIVLAPLEGEFTIKRYRKRNGSGYKRRTRSSPTSRSPRGPEGQVWGVVANSIRML